MSVANHLGRWAFAQQQQEALNELLGENARVHVYGVDREGFVKALTGENVHSLPGNFAVIFDGVTSLRLTDSNSLTGLSPILGMRNLHRLMLARCDGAFALPTGLGDATLLRELCLHQCTNFDYSSLTRANLAGLERLDVYDSDIEQVPSSIFSMDVRRLHMKFGSVKSIPNQIENLQHVDDLSIYGDEIESIALGRLVCRGRLFLSCPSLTEFTVGADSLGELECFGLRECRNLEGLPAPLPQWKGLKKLGLEECYNLSIPEADILECSASLVNFEGGFFGQEDDHTDAANRTHDLLHHMVCVNKSGRRLLKRRQSIPSALWSHVLGQCSNSIDCLLFYLKEMPDLRQDQSSGSASSRKRKASSLLY